MGLMLLAARWAAAQGSRRPALHVATVDHGLRPEAAREARVVAGAARRLGLDHTTLLWSEQKPRSGLPAAAREARYRLLTDEARRIGAAAILTAHTESDQAETLLMRLARGSGVDGLAAIAGESRLNGIRLLRPLLGVTRERLRATLRTGGETWVEDPSNENESHERVRMRRAAGMLDDLGLSAAALALSAHRLGRAKAALRAASDALARTAAVFHPSGYVQIDRASFLAAPEELSLRLLVRAIAAVGAAAGSPDLAQVEAALGAMLAPSPHAMTLGGCKLVPRGVRLLVFREAGRKGLPVLTLRPGETAIWDGRHEVALLPRETAPVEVRAPSAAELKRLADDGHWQRRSLPLEAARAAPLLVRGGQVIAAPMHGYAGAIAVQVAWPRHVA
jgi:tRNA(Ile)-lysidine synthase